MYTYINIYVYINDFFKYKHPYIYIYICNNLIYNIHRIRYIRIFTILIITNN